MEERVKDELIEQFRAYLDNDCTESPPAEGLDQISLFTELAGLKNEVKIESRQLKGALEDFRQAFTALDTGQQELVALVKEQQTSRKQTAQTESAVLIDGLIDLYDRIAAGLVRKPPQPSFIERLIPGGQRSHRWLKGYLEGQQMLLDRVLHLLGQCGTEPVEAKGKQFDALEMKAFDFKSDTSRPEGEVLEEVRKGFRQNQRLVRPVEVIVNKRG